MEKYFNSAYQSFAISIFFSRKLTTHLYFVDPALQLFYMRLTVHRSPS
jgi:hypothetical protein